MAQGHILSKYNYHHVDACQVYVKEGLLYLKRLNTSMIIVIKEFSILPAMSSSRVVAFVISTFFNLLRFTLWPNIWSIGGNPLQYSCLGNPRTEEPGGLSPRSRKSQTQLSN